MTALCLTYIILPVALLCCMVALGLYRRQRQLNDRLKRQLAVLVGLMHDLRTPAALLTSSLGELQTATELNEEKRKYLLAAQKSLEKMIALNSQILDWQKAELQSPILHLTSCDLSLYLEGKINEYLPMASQKGLELHADVPADMPDAWIDTEKIDHIVDNLLGNALKYTQQGSISLRVRQGRDNWTLEVSDTGIGIPAEEQPYVFREARRARNASTLTDHGTGLGLLLTHRLVEQHQGHITFHSTEGQGTTFTASFPLEPKGKRVRKDTNTDIHTETETDAEMESASSAAPPPSAETSSGTSAERDNKNVLLLAEDDNDMREYLTDALASDYRVVSVADGGKALETARAINPDIILSDVVMPVLHGDELCRMLKSSVDTSHIPVVLLTALCAREDIVYGLEAGANDYIVKPFDLRVLKARLRNVLQDRQRFRNSVLTMEDRPEEVDYSSLLDKKFMDRVMEVIGHEMDNPDFSINDFCRMMGMSRTSIYNKLKTLTGKGPADYIRIVRLNKSKALLKTKKYTIGEVASLVGFSDPKYFSTCFKKQFGISPSKI